MGKFKVSFTTALFVFSFFVCVIVAVVFVDRNSSPREDDGFYDSGNNAPARANDPAAAPANSVWASRNAPTATSTPAAATAEDPSLADLPLDPHLLGAAQSVPPLATVTPQPTLNPMVGRSPEQVLHQLQRNPHLVGAPANPTVPGLPVPDGIATPGAGGMMTATPTPQATPRTYLPMQSNISSHGSGAATGAIQGMGMSNSGAGWNTTTNQQLPSHMIGTQGAPISPNDGTMISRDRIQSGAQAPPGFSNTVTNPSSSLPSLSSPTGDDYSPLPPHLRSTPDAAPPGTEKWELPPAPTLAPPLIQAPGGGPQSDAGDNNAVPGETNPEGSLDQALAVSEPATEPESASTEDVTSAQPTAIAVRVNDKELTEDEAARLARVASQLRPKSPGEPAADPQDQITQSIRQWTAITAAAEQARKEEITLSSAEIDKYAAAQKDFDLAAWKKAMASAGFTRAQIDQQLADRALAEKLVESRFEKQYDEDKLKAAYNKTPKTYSTPYQVQVQEIYRAKPTDEKRAEQVKKEMQRLQRQAGGTDFSLLARQVSEAPSKANGGDLGWKTPSEKKDADIAKAIADLKEGEVSQVIEGEDGYRIYRVAATREARDNFEASRDLVAEKLREELRENVLADARKEQKVDLTPTKEIKVVHSDKTTVTTPPEIKTEQASSSSGSSSSAPRRDTPPAPKATPRPGHLLAAPGTTPAPAAQAGPTPVAQGGAPGPVNQAGGQPAPATTGNNTPGYFPGQTMVVGETAAAPTPVAIGEATPIPGLSPEQQAQQLQYMQEQQRSAVAQRNQQVEAQAQAARAYAEQQAQQRAEHEAIYGTRQPGAEATPSNVTHSNGWRVTRRDQAATDDNPAALAEPAPSQIPPGFEGHTSDNSTDARQREGGMLNNVRSFFSRRRDD